MFCLFDTDIVPFYSFYLYDQLKLPVTAFEILIQKVKDLKIFHLSKIFPIQYVLNEKWVSIIHNLRFI